MSNVSRRLAASSLLAVATIAGLAVITPAAADGTARSCLTSEARSLLSKIEAKFGSVQIISTCRPGAVIAGSGRRSKHASGEAIDFRVPGRKSDVVRWLVSNHRSGGVMTYSDMDHIHVDVGQHFVSLASRN